MVDIFPNLAQSASTGVIRGLELARIRSERRRADRQLREQSAALADVQSRIALIPEVDELGERRPINDIANDRAALLLEASGNPALSLEQRNLFANEYRTIVSSRDNRARPSTNGLSALSFATQGLNSQPTDLGLTNPIPAAEPAAQPDNVDNTGGITRADFARRARELSSPAPVESSISPPSTTLPGNAPANQTPQVAPQPTATPIPTQQTPVPPSRSLPGNAPQSNQASSPSDTLTQADRVPAPSGQSNIQQTLLALIAPSAQAESSSTPTARLVRSANLSQDLDVGIRSIASLLGDDPGTLRRVRDAIVTQLLQRGLDPATITTDQLLQLGVTS